MNLLHDNDMVEVDVSEVLKKLNCASGVSGISGVGSLENISIPDEVSIELNELDGTETEIIASDVVIITTERDDDVCKTDEMQQMREINRNSCENEKPFTDGIRVEYREIELPIYTSTVEEMIFKRQRVEIIDKQTRFPVMEGIIVKYHLVGRSYDPDIVLEFEDGRGFYNENFGYLMRFYI
jgi:hypothetical protein